MGRQDGILRVVLTGKWFDMIERGEKLEEYREGSAYWAQRLLDEDARAFLVDESGNCEGVQSVHSDRIFQYHTLVASRGYTARTLTRKIRRIRWGTLRPEWSGDTVTGDCFVIELEDETDRAILPV